MSKQLVIVLCAIVLLPTAVLAWMGIRAVANEHQAREHELQQLAMAQLRSLDQLIQGHFQDMAGRLERDYASLALDVRAARTWLQQSVYVRQLLAMDGDGARLYPPSEGPLTDRERRFLERTQGIWDDGAGFAQNTAVAEPSTNSLNRSALAQRFVPKNVVLKSGRARQYGWYVWYAADGMNHIFWVRENTGRVVGFELYPARIAADIIARLPATAVEDALANSTIRLVNERSATVYQWGAGMPSKEQRPMALLPLSHPLGSWHLAYFPSARLLEQLGGNGMRWFGLTAILLVVMAALGGLVYVLYREHTRATRLAGQRVNFVNQVSHELKTPLTNIRMYAELLDEQIEEEGKPRKYIDVIVTESQRLSRLIGNVLNFAQAQKKQLSFQAQPKRLDDIIESCLEAFRPNLRAKGVRIAFNPGIGDVAMVDADCVEQILNNLFSNAEKYGHTGGRLEVSSERLGDDCRIKVRDYGPGIPGQERERVFQAFYRVSSQLSDGVSGTGIGLEIARRMAQLHGGDLQLCAVDSGACFELRLHAPVAEEET